MDSIGEKFTEIMSNNLIEQIQNIHDDIVLLQSEEIKDQCNDLQSDYVFGRIHKLNQEDVQKKETLTRIETIMSRLKENIKTLARNDIGHNFEDEKLELFMQIVNTAHNICVYENNLEIVKAGIDRIFSSPMQLMVENNVESLSNCVNAYKSFSETIAKLYTNMATQSEMFLNQTKTK